MISSSLLSLEHKISAREAVIGVVGLGYVGLPLAIRFAREGFRVVGLDIDKSKTESLSDGNSYIEHIPKSEIEYLVESGALFSNNFEHASSCDSLIICVPTPLNKYREPDLSFVVGTVETLANHLRKGQLVSLESTTYPGTTQEELVPRVSRLGLEVGDELFVCYSPEREDPGNPNFTTRTIPKVVGGVSSNCLRAGLALYGEIIDQVVPVSSPAVAEMTKLLENIHRSVNIGLVNEMKVVSDRMGIDIHEVIDAAKTKPFGFTAYYPGPGLGGHCIPIDPFYLTWKAREFGVHTRFIELAGEINQAMPEYVLSKLIDGLNSLGTALNGASILVLGIAYKKDVDDMRESPSVEIMELIRRKGGTVAYSDPHVPSFPKMREHSFELESVEISEVTLKNYDAVVLSTDHSAFDYELIASHARLLVDCRGKFRESKSNLVKA